ncbi:MAG: hypothetical protein Q8922_03700 [Bacteroidota bacterium]|nr:hypothetical protein [Bacteroidota bacterium]MDP4233397.1 hypothetical protein [Bacteroidota bacterium]MDP4242263.1 hypothetical protein [Bacteroidota bacterium]MDP4287019.1 hypothetical protein [Bacteroidota bacterium]
MVTVRQLVLSVLLVGIASGQVVRAQDSLRAQRFEYVIGATAAFSLFDFLAYSGGRTVFNFDNGSSGLMVYHILQSSLGVAINYFLYRTCGLPAALAFDLTWWTWGDDLAFYGWADALNLPSPWLNRTDNGLRNNPEISWASWTPIGMVRPKGSSIARSTIVAQAIVGFSISLAFLW